MQAFTFRAILLHALPDNQGWQIFGIPRFSTTRELIATLSPVVSHQEARKLADQLANSLAGMPRAEED